MNSYIVDFSNYDSSSFATFPESIDHAMTNELLMSNLSDKLIYRRNGNEEVVFQDPNCAFKELIHFFDPYLKETDILDHELYRPEMTAKRLYNNADFWELILIVNNIPSVTFYNQKKIKYIPGNVLTKISFFRNMHKNNLRVVEQDEASKEYT
ncbi:hypothetical protein [Proteus mirabilis]|uniref:hypothetical protein n=1 Tax=Proteus mirabilis TaxID=584 RepID=UPI0034D4D360